MKTKIIFYKEKIITSLFILVCLLLYGLFPTNGVFQDLISALTFLAIVPILYIKFILKKDLKNFGLNLGDLRQGILWSLVLIIFSLLLIYTLAQYTDFAKNYFIPDYSRQFFLFVLNEVFVVGLFVVLYEFFFRGFVQFSFISQFGYGSIILQALIFVLFLASTGNLSWPFLPYVIVAPLSGVIVYRCRSILYSSLAGLVFFTIADAYLIYITR